MFGYKIISEAEYYEMQKDLKYLSEQKNFWEDKTFELADEVDQYRYKEYCRGFNKGEIVDVEPIEDGTDINVGNIEQKYDKDSAIKAIMAQVRGRIK